MFSLKSTIKNLFGFRSDDDFTDLKCSICGVSMNGIPKESCDSCDFKESPEYEIMSTIAETATKEEQNRVAEMIKKYIGRDIYIKLSNIAKITKCDHCGGETSLLRIMTGAVGVSCQCEYCGSGIIDGVWFYVVTHWSEDSPCLSIEASKEALILRERNR